MHHEKKMAIEALKGAKYVFLVLGIIGAIVSFGGAPIGPALVAASLVSITLVMCASALVPDEDWKAVYPNEK